MDDKKRNKILACILGAMIVIMIVLGLILLSLPGSMVQDREQPAGKQAAAWQDAKAD